ncbi:MAG: GNAT family N-acetyltransferase [Bacteroidota bacterium]
MNQAINIIPLNADNMAQFLVYLQDHISDNGQGSTPLFLPISRWNLRLPEHLADSFQKGLDLDTHTTGWRRGFMAIDQKGEIAGHIDLRSHPQAHTLHRALLGMGVHRDFRKKGLGSQMLTFLVEWAQQETELAYIDLWVMAENKPAIRLYQKMGFEEIARVKDKFRIDGEAQTSVMMAKPIQ